MNPVSPNKGEQVMSTEQQGSCLTIELLNRTSKMYQDISKERREGGGGGMSFLSKVYPTLAKIIIEIQKFSSPKSQRDIVIN